jgi:hypothetical protein
VKCSRRGLRGGLRRTFFVVFFVLRAIFLFLWNGVHKSYLAMIVLGVLGKEFIQYLQGVCELVGGGWWLGTST